MCVHCKRILLLFKQILCQLPTSTEQKSWYHTYKNTQHKQKIKKIDKSVTIIIRYARRAKRSKINNKQQSKHTKTKTSNNIYMFCCRFHDTWQKDLSYNKMDNIAHQRFDQNPVNFQKKSKKIVPGRVVSNYKVSAY